MRHSRSTAQAAPRTAGRPRPLAALILLLAAFTATPAAAFNLTPMVEDFQPAGRETVKNFTVSNTTGQRIAVEIKMARRTMKPDGGSLLAPADKDFVVFPAQVALEPGTSQSVQVRWVGEAEPKTELAYRIVAEQLPVSLEKTRQDVASVRMLIRYEGSVYVMAKDAKADIRLDGLRRVEGKDGKTALEATLVNRGGAHGIVHAPKLALTDARGTRATIDGQAAKALDNINVLAGATRRVLLPWPANLKAGTVTGTLESKVGR